MDIKVYKFFDKKSASFVDKSTADSGVTTLANKSAFNKIKQNKQSAEELCKPIITKFLKKNTYSTFKDNIWGADLADMQLINMFNNRIRFLFCVIDIYSKYACLVPLKDKKGVTIASVFQKVLDKSDCKPNKIWVDKGSKFYNRSMKLWLKDNYIEMYSTHNQEKSVAAERFITNLKLKFISI